MRREVCGQVWWSRRPPTGHSPPRCGRRNQRITSITGAVLSFVVIIHESATGHRARSSAPRKVRNHGSSRSVYRVSLVVVVRLAYGERRPAITKRKLDQRQPEFIWGSAIGMSGRPSRGNAASSVIWCGPSPVEVAFICANHLDRQRGRSVSDDTPQGWSGGAKPQRS